MRYDKHDRLLREYITHVLEEESKETLYNTFVSPFTDVFKTAQASIESVSAHAKAAFKIFMKRIKPRILSVVNQSYDEIFREAKQRVQEVKSKHADVFRATDAALSDDARVVAFMMNPEVFLGATALATVDKHAISSMRKSVFDIMSDSFRRFLSVGDRIARPTSFETVEGRWRREIQKVLNDSTKHLSEDDRLKLAAASGAVVEDTVKETLADRARQGLEEFGMEDSEFGRHMMDLIKKTRGS